MYKGDYNQNKIELSQVFSLLEALSSKIDNLVLPPDQKILDDIELQEMLKVAKRTTAYYRSQKLIAYSKYGNGKIFYKLSDILAFLDRNRIESIESEIKIKI